MPAPPPAPAPPLAGYGPEFYSSDYIELTNKLERNSKLVSTILYVREKIRYGLYDRFG